MDSSIRLMSAQDIVAADEIRALAGWNQRPADWLRLLKCEPSGCFVALVNDRLVGTVTTTCYDDELAWIGMMLVHPDYRHRGLGRRLMTAALEYLNCRPTRCIMLDATPAGKPLYEKLGFQAEWPFSRWIREAPGVKELGNERASGPEPEDSLGELALDQHRELDRLAFGCSRWSYIQRVADDSQVVVTDQGFGMLRRGSLANYLGPVTANSPAAAQRLIAKLLHKVNERVVWDVLEPNCAAVQLAINFQFQPVRPLQRMRLGTASLPADLAKQFAIADPGTG